MDWELMKNRLKDSLLTNIPVLLYSDMISLQTVKVS